jgi:hypothetical protein
MSYLTQMLGLGVQNFLSAATVVVVALVRGFARHSASGVGNAWVDLTSVTLWVLLPLSFVLALALVSQGVVQTFDTYKEVQTLEVVKYPEPKLGADGQPLKASHDADRIPAADAPGRASALRSHAPATAERGLGAEPQRGHALPAGLPGTAAQEGGSRSRATAAPRDGNRHRVSLRSVAREPATAMLGMPVARA